jgi:hypothetical protein
MKPVVPLLLCVALPALVAPAQTVTFAVELKALETEYRKLLQANLPEESPDAKDARIKAGRETIRQKLSDLITRAKGTPTSLGARMFALRVYGVSADALDEIVKTEATNPDMARHLPQLTMHARAFDPARRDAWLSAIEADSPYEGVKAAVLLIRARSQTSDTAVTTLKGLIEKYPTTLAAAQAKTVLFEKEYLQIGKAAPEIEGKDENGEKITLSEYRGKVVVLDFWGFW